MIELKNVSKSFDGIEALKNVSVTVREGEVFGLIGTNGAGKSTLLRLACGVFKPDDGLAIVDNMPVYDNVHAKAKLFFIADEPYFFNGATPKDMERYYSSVYRNFDRERFYLYLNSFGLESRRRISTFSKGMKKQLAILLGLSAKTEYLLCDETFDGLDPVMRNLVKNIIYNDVMERGTTTVITSHSLRELEDTCDQLALLHKGGIIFESDIQDLKTSLFKVQVAFNYDYDRELFQNIDMLSFSKKGTVSNFIVRGDREGTIASLRSMNPILLDVLPLSLEEVFIYEMEALGYAFKDVLM